LKLALTRLGSIIGENRSEPAERSRASLIYSIAEWVTIAALLLYALFAPHSIAITQGACLLGLFAWAVQVALGRRLDQSRTPIDIALLGFFACCVVSSFLSYDAPVSIKGLKSPAFFLAFYLVATKVRTVAFARLMILAMIGSCLFNVGATGQQLSAGRGLRIDGIREGSAFEHKGLEIGDVIVEADDQKVESPQELIAIIENGRGPLRVVYDRNEQRGEIAISRKALRDRAAHLGDPLGLYTSRGRNFRVQGFFSHYETYAEVLQLIGALAIGFLITLPRRKSLEGYFLALAILLISAALIFTATRAPLLGLAAATLAMAAASGRRRVVIVALSLLVLTVPIAIYKLESSRGPAVLTTEEGSATYRFEVWREAMGLIKDHPLVGIGKGSEAKLKESLELYDGGRLPPGHFHSTLVQIAVWWGLPALALYCAMMMICLATAWRITRESPPSAWQVRGISIGGLGALVAFNVSSVVHFNFGDGEVVMALWLITGLLFAIHRMTRLSEGAVQPSLSPAQSSEEHSRKSRPPAPAAAAESPAPAARAARN
jgi:membrane-associated protease RseP (regulator of RpoE activity)